MISINMADTAVCSNEYSQLKRSILQTIDLFRNPQKEIKLWQDAMGLEKLLIEEYLRRQNQVKIEIHELTQKVEKAEKAALQRDPKHFALQFSALKNDEAVTLNSIKKMEEELKKNNDNIEKLKKACSEIERETIQFRESVLSQLPRSRHAVSLYRTISGIMWDFESPRVKGVMVLKHKVKTFDLNATSKYEIAQALWKMMDDNE
jgi:chromosome segregation ATPase